jgi:hypothetical protein
MPPSKSSRKSSSTSSSKPRAARRAGARPSPPLGSLTQPGSSPGGRCRACGSERVTILAMSLTDGSPVELVSCHVCEHRSWLSEDGEVLDIATVLDRTRKPRPGA